MAVPHSEARIWENYPGRSSSLGACGSKDVPVEGGYFAVSGSHPETGRNLRNVWTIATHSFAEAHFATFPPLLAERCIRAGTSERGCCANCGSPWVREVETSYTLGGPKHSGNAKALRYIRDGEREDSGYKTRHDVTLGWLAGCKCNAPTQPCTVLDPFAGAGTVGLVADRLQRDAVLIELNPAYAAMARNRITDDAGMFAEVAD